MPTYLGKILVPSVSVAFAIQTAFAIPSIVAQCERFYDVSGALTFLSVTLLSLYLPSLRTRSAAALKGTNIKLPSILSAFISGGAAGVLNWRQVALSAARVLNEGKDSRFDEIKTSPPKFFAAWMGQATWVSLCLMPVIAINSIPPAIFAALPRLKSTDFIGLALYLGGLVFEVAADRQKSWWLHEKRTKQHDEAFLTQGLWSKRQYPTYFGESTLWTGIATVAAVLALGLSYVGPAFVSLLTKVSGIPMSEEEYDKRYGDRKDYQVWKKNTPRFFPKLSRDHCRKASDS
ncbi:hypothetical protein BJ170DRAFT_700786 [Xylariales sp. AK1849]|nr:hypothetical protein BJ170DRAFT_709996 [Xylariales sp. AK1849]KAI0129559.1 hypothetical protein BJ170DRAFT_700786 [Xylariales sp. AK1849]